MDPLSQRLQPVIASPMLSDCLPILSFRSMQLGRCSEKAAALIRQLQDLDGYGTITDIASATSRSWPRCSLALLTGRFVLAQLQGTDRLGLLEP